MRSIYTNALVFDGTDACEPYEATIIVEDGVISQVTREFMVSGYRSEQVVNLKGAFVMPGLINAHAHHFGTGMPSKTLSGGWLQDALIGLVSRPVGRPLLRAIAKRALTATLLSGVTCTRGVGDFAYIDVELRDLRAQGRWLGPHIVASGPAITCPGGHGAGTFATVATTPEEFRAQVAERADHGVDFIKLCVTGGVMDSEVAGEAGLLKMTEEQTRAAVAAAADKNLYVAAHTEGPEGVAVDLAAGVYTIEHGAPVSDELYDTWKESGAADICTLAVSYPLSVLPTAKTKLLPVGQTNAKLVRNRIAQCAKRCLELGIPVGIGSDASCPYVTHYDLWRDVLLMSAFAGVEPAQALRMVTLGNARILKLDAERGSLELGKQADFIVLAPGANPLTNLRDLAQVDKVVVGGTLIENCQHKLKRFRSRALDAELDALYTPQALATVAAELDASDTSDIPSAPDTSNTPEPPNTPEAPNLTES